MQKNLAVFTCITFFSLPCFANDGGVFDLSTGDAKEISLPENAPDSVTEALVEGKNVINLAKAKKYFAMSAGCIWLLMFFFKLGRKHIPMLMNIPRRWLYIVVAMLTFLAMLFTKLQTDMSWSAALIVLTSGPFVAYLNDLIKRGVFNKTPTEEK